MKYEYASLSSLSEYKKQFSPEVLRNLSKLYSDRINRIVGKQFIATPKILKVNPFSKLFKVPGSPIIKVNSIYADFHDGSRTFLEPSRYEVKENNLIRLKDLAIEGVEALEINCIMGLMEYPKDIQVELVTQIEAYESTATLNSTEGLEVRDVLTYGNTPIIITGIDYTNNIIDFDDVGNIPTMPIGATLSCYGQVPLQIEEAVKLFIKHHKKLQGFAGRITSERIGKSYSYDTTGLESSITGIAEIDSILFLFINDDFDILFL